MFESFISFGSFGKEPFEFVFELAVL